VSNIIEFKYYCWTQERLNWRGHHFSVWSCWRQHCRSKSLTSVLWGRAEGQWWALVWTNYCWPL